MTNFIFSYFFGQIQNLLENDVWKNWIFCFAPFHIGALCSKTLEHFWQALEWSNQKIFCIFPNIIFQKILNLAKKVAKYQVCHFCQIWITLVIHTLIEDSHYTKVKVNFIERDLIFSVRLREKTKPCDVSDVKWFKRRIKRGQCWPFKKLRFF